MKCVLTLFQLIGDWVLVAFPGKWSEKHFVGNVISKCDALEEVYVKFLRYDADTGKFHWSLHDDESYIELKDVKGKLAPPNQDQRQKYTFSFDFSCVILG